MTKLFTDELMTLRQAAELLPGRPHVSTIWRWAMRGLAGGRRLRTTLVGGQRFTSRGDLEDFIRELNGDAPRPDPTEAARKADEGLAAAGA